MVDTCYGTGAPTIAVLPSDGGHFETISLDTSSTNWVWADYEGNPAKNARGLGEQGYIIVASYPPFSMPGPQPSHE